MDTRSHAARLWFVVMLVAGISGATDRVQAAAIGAQLGADRSGVDGDTPPNSTYTDEFGLVAGLQGEFGVAHDFRRPLHVGRNPGNLPLHTRSLLSGIPGRCITRRTERCESAWYLAHDRRRDDAKRNVAAVSLLVTVRTREQSHSAVRSVPTALLAGSKCY